MAIIFVADDDGSIRKLLTVVLRSAGHDVLCAGDLLACAERVLSLR